MRRAPQHRASPAASDRSCGRTKHSRRCIKSHAAPGWPAPSMQSFHQQGVGRSKHLPPGQPCRARSPNFRSLGENRGFFGPIRWCIRGTPLNSIGTVLGNSIGTPYLSTYSGDAITTAPLGHFHPLQMDRCDAPTRVWLSRRGRSSDLLSRRQGCRGSRRSRTPR